MQGMETALSLEVIVISQGKRVGGMGILSLCAMTTTRSCHARDCDYAVSPRHVSVHRRAFARQVSSLTRPLTHSPTLPTDASSPSLCTRTLSVSLFYRILRTTSAVSIRQCTKGEKMTHIVQAASHHIEHTLLDGVFAKSASP